MDEGDSTCSSDMLLSSSREPVKLQRPESLARIISPAAGKSHSPDPMDLQESEALPVWHCGVIDANHPARGQHVTTRLDPMGLRIRVIASLVLITRVIGAVDLLPT